MGPIFFFYFPQNYYYLDHGIYYKIDDKSIANNGKTNQKKHGKLSFVIFQVINEWKIFKKQSLLYYEDY